MERWLAILRHGKSERGPQFEIDFERPLAPRGIKAAQAVGRLLASHDPPVELIVTSPATRALHTAQLVQAELDDAPLSEDNGIYAATLSGLLSTISAFADNIGCVLLVGHNPGLEELAAHLAGDPSVLLKTCSLVWVKLDGRTWGDAVQMQGILVGIQHPRESAD